MSLYREYLQEVENDLRIEAEMEAETERETLRLHYALMTAEERDSYEREIGHVPYDY